MTAFCQARKARGISIGFVPTMGALHQGHLSLVQQASNTCDAVVVSIFVNPTQFNDTSDLEKYPRTFDADRSMLEDAGVTALFYPSVDEIYPKREPTNYDLDGLDQLMEGPSRPGHFNGVVQVVTRLFDIVEPEMAFFGEKDFQQLAIIRHMSTKLGYRVKIFGCPTIRERSGLAMSSRNVRLSESGKRSASALSRSLEQIKQRLSEGANVVDAIKPATDQLKQENGVELEYLELVDVVTLHKATNETPSIQACVAAYVEGVRLIDNMQVK